MAKKLLLLLLKAVVLYIVVFLLWLVISPYYLQCIAFTSAKLLPLILVDNYRVQSYQIMGKDERGGSQRNLLRYYIQVSPQVRNWIEFGANDLTYPIVTFFTLVLVTPNLAWKKRVKILILGFIALWLFYSVLALLFFRVIDFVNGRGLSGLGIVEDLLGMERLARWKLSGGITILTGQMVPVAVWFVSVFGQIRRLPKIGRPDKSALEKAKQSK